MSASNHGAHVTTENLLGVIGTDEFERRYPDRTHLIPGDHPRHGEMATRALFAGDPVAIVYPDGHEVLFTPEHARGVAGIFLLLAVFWLRLRSRRSDKTALQLPPRTHIEARDSEGMPIAA